MARLLPWIIVLLAGVGAALAAPAATQASAATADTTGAWAVPTQDSAPINRISDLKFLRDAGLDVDLWGWTYYQNSEPSTQRNLWYGELQADVTKTFGDRVALVSDFKLVDDDGRPRALIQQAYLSTVIAPDSGAVVTVGKFASPFGAERREYWDRSTATPSLLYFAQPQDLRGILLTLPIDKTDLVLRPFLVTGFDDEGYIPSRPSTGLMADYHPGGRFDLGVTNWFGPALQPKRYSGFGPNFHFVPGETILYPNDNYYLTDTNDLQNFTSDDRGHLYYLNAQARWKPRNDLTLLGEYLLVYSDNLHDGKRYWDGDMFQAKYDIDPCLWAYGQWSFLNDVNGEVTSYPEYRQAISTGLGYRFNDHLEMRAEYRRDLANRSDDSNTISVDLSFGY